MGTVRMSRSATLIRIAVSVSIILVSVAAHDIGFAQTPEAVAKGVYEWLTPARLRGQPGAPRLVGTTTEGNKTLVHIGMPNNELITFECMRLDRGGTLCIVPGRSDLGVELP
jgi:hypothetical protein